MWISSRWITPGAWITYNPENNHCPMKTVMLLVSLLAAVSLAAALTPEEEATADGLWLSFELGAAYEKAVRGENVTAYNSLVDQWNAWVMTNLKNDTTLLREKIVVSVETLEPYIVENNNTSEKIVHEIDSKKTYSTNDLSSLPDSVRDAYAQTEEGKVKINDYLGGV